MKKRCALVLVLGLVFGGVSAVADGPPAPPETGPMLWVIDGPPRVYIYGTLPDPTPAAESLPETVQAAFDSADTYVCEMPWDDTTRKVLGQFMKRQSVLTAEAGGMKKLVGEELYDRVKKLLPKDFHVNALETREPWFVAAVLLQKRTDDLNPDGKACTSHALFKKAQLRSKQVVGLDTPPEFVDAFDVLSLEDQVRMLELTMDYIEKDTQEKGKHLKQLQAAYHTGDVEKVAKVAREGYPADDPVVKKISTNLGLERNKRMASRLAMRIKREGDKTFFVALEAARLPGEEGILKLLADADLKPRRAAADEKIPD